MLFGTSGISLGHNSNHMTSTMPKKEGSRIDSYHGWGLCCATEELRPQLAWRSWLERAWDGIRDAVRALTMWSPWTHKRHTGSMV